MTKCNCPIGSVCNCAAPKVIYTANIQARVSTIVKRRRKPNKLEKKLISNYIENLLQYIDELRGFL